MRQRDKGTDTEYINSGKETRERNGATNNVTVSVRNGSLEAASQRRLVSHTERDDEYRDASLNGRCRFSPGKLETFQSAILLPGKKGIPGRSRGHERSSRGETRREYPAYPARSVAVA